MSNEGIVSNGLAPTSLEGSIPTPAEQAFPNPRSAAVIGQLTLAEQVVLVGKLESEILEKDRTIAELSIALAEARRTLEEAQIDEVTGIYKREKFTQFTNDIEHETPERARRFDPDTQVLIIGMADLKDFKTINDTQGHLIGDAALHTTAQSVRSAVRKKYDDLVVRYGGDEFLIAIIIDKDKITDEKPLPLILDKIKNRIKDKAFEDFAKSKYKEDPEKWEEAKELFAGISVGLSVYQPGEPMNRTISRADQAMYEDKHPQEQNTKPLENPVLIDPRLFL